MTKKIIISILASAALSSTVVAKPNMEKSPEGTKKLIELAGEKSPYYRTKKEDFPKDYFLVSQNLPYLVGTALFHPESDTLKLTAEQFKTLREMKRTIVPVSAKMAKTVKTMELKLASEIVENRKDPKELGELVEKIAKTKTEMTKAHLDCIHTVQKLLTPEQFDILVELASHQ